MGSPINVLQRLGAARVVATLRAPSAAGALRACDALVAGGIMALEITYSTPDAATAIVAARERYGDRATVGAGTLRTPAQVHEAVDAGADFLVSPASEEEVVAAMTASGRCWLAGAMTPTEMSRLVRAGARAVKLFPANVVGPGFLRAVRAPMPELKIIPTGGIGAGDVETWLEAGAHAVGAGSELCSSKDIGAGRWDAIEAAARAFTRGLT